MAEVPDGLAHLWADFLALHGSRTFGPAAANPIAFADIAAYAGLMGVTFTAWELGLFKRLDASFRSGRFQPAEFEPVNAVKALFAGAQQRGRGTP